VGVHPSRLVGEVAAEEQAVRANGPHSGESRAVTSFRTCCGRASVALPWRQVPRVRAAVTETARVVSAAL
jgi:hypothetical protein